MSVKMKQDDKPWFEVNEDGLLKIFPLSEAKSSTKKRQKIPVERLDVKKELFELEPGKSTSKKPKILPIRPLDPNELVMDLDSPRQPAKRRLVEKSVRKELFKAVPKNEKVGRKSITSRLRPSTTRNSFLRRPNSVRASINSNLIDIDEAEEQLLKRRSSRKNGFNFKSPSVPEINFAPKGREKVVFSKTTIATPLPKSRTPSKKCRARLPIEQTPQTLEFKNLEKLCDNTNSPSLSSVCSLLEQTNIASAKKTTTNNDDTQQDMQRVISLIQKMQMNFMKFQKQQAHDMKTCVDILNILVDTSRSNSSKEICLKSNSVGSPNKENKTKLPAVSPALMTNIDLRKSTLKKNFAIRNRPLSAIQYNKMEGDVGLITPKQKTRLNSPISLVKRMKSLENQLFPDTPIHK